MTLLSGGGGSCLQAEGNLWGTGVGFQLVSHLASHGKPQYPNWAVEIVPSPLYVIL